jgi:hypothetical protein
MYLRATILRQCIAQLDNVNMRAADTTIRVLTSRVYNCTLAFLCASLLIKAATASLGLYPSSDLAKVISAILQAALKDNTTYPDSSAPTLSHTSCQHKIRGQIVCSFLFGKGLYGHNGRSLHTRMYSQFSDVRFSSVALAVGKKTISQKYAYNRRLKKGNEKLVGVRYQLHRQKRSAARGTLLDSRFQPPGQMYVEVRKQHWKIYWNSSPIGR